MNKKKFGNQKKRTGDVKKKRLGSHKKMKMTGVLNKKGSAMKTINEAI